MRQNAPRGYAEAGSRAALAQRGNPARTRMIPSIVGMESRELARAEARAGTARENPVRRRRRNEVPVTHRKKEMEKEPKSAHFI